MIFERSVRCSLCGADTLLMVDVQISRRVGGNVGSVDLGNWIWVNDWWVCGKHKITLVNDMGQLPRIEIE